MGGDSFYKGRNCKEQIAEIKKQKNAPAIEYIDTMLGEKQLAGLYAACDVLVHPYRGEGFGLPILEAMACGTPAIVPNGGACLDFCTGENSLLVEARKMVFQEKRVDTYATTVNPWLLEPSLEDLKSKMLYAVTHPKELAALGKRAHDDVHASWTWDHAYAVLKERIAKLMDKPVRRFSADDQDDAQLVLAERLLGEDKIAEAVQILSFLVGRNPANINALNDLAAASIMTANYPAAADFLTRVIALDPTNETAQENWTFLRQSRIERGEPAASIPVRLSVMQ